MKLTSTRRAGEHMRDVEGEACVITSPPRRKQQRAEQAEHQRDAEEVGHAENAHLGDRGLEQREQQRRRPPA